MLPFITLLHQRKKKRVFCFSFIQQFRSITSILEIIICNTVRSVTPDSLFLWAFLLKGNKTQESLMSCYVFSPYDRSCVKKIRNDPANLVNHRTSLPAPHVLQLWVTLVLLHKSPSDKMSATGS